MTRRRKARVRVGVIGCGGIAQMMHLPFLAERPDLFSIEALADIDERTLREVGRLYHVSRLHTDYRQLLEEPIDAVLVLSDDSHTAPVVAAAQAGKHILVEKPLAENMDEVKEIAAAVRRADVVLMVGYHKRYDPGYLYAREQVHKLTDLRMVRADVLHPVDALARSHYHIVPAPMFREKLTNANSEATDGLLQRVTDGPARSRIEAIIGTDAPVEQRVATFLLFNSLIHDINALRGILGEPKDVVLAEFWKNGRCMHVVLRWRHDLRCALSWLYLPGLRNYKEELVFLGSDSRVSVTFPSPYYRNFPTPVVVEAMEGEHLVRREVTVSMEEAFRAELHHFHECVTLGISPRTGLADAMADTELLEEIAKSYRKAANGLQSVV